MKKKNKYVILTVICTLMFLGFLYWGVNMISTTCHWDSCRHSSASHIYMDFFKTCLSGQGCSWTIFSTGYNNIIPAHLSWYLSIDPPFHAIVQGLFFLVVGASFLTSRLTTGVFILFGAPVLFLLARKLLKSNALGLMTVVLFLLSPLSIFLSPMTLLSMPIAFAMVGWYYFTFHKEPKINSFKLGKKVFNLNRNYIYGAIFLSAAGLMKYQSMIFYAGFMLVYLAYLLIIKNFKEAKELFKIGFIQSIVFFLLCGWWLKYLYTSGIWERVLYEGAGRVREWTFSYLTFYFRDTFPQTFYLVSFAFLPLLFKNGRKWIKNNARLLIYVLTIYIISTFLISNQQLRYMVHAIPFLFIIIVRGINDLSRWISKKIKKFDWKSIRLDISLLLILILMFAAVTQVNEIVDERGMQDYEWMEEVSQIPNPKLLVYIHGPKNKSSGFYANPDMWMFGAMQIQNEHNPKKMQQFMQYVYWNTIKGQPKLFFDAMDPYKQQMNIIITVPKYRIMTNDVDTILIEKGYNKAELKWYNVYY